MIDYFIYDISWGYGMVLNLYFIYGIQNGIYKYYGRILIIFLDFMVMYSLQ